jgi:pimeloyl-ACP methyl ester carboxylesterase
MTETPNLVPGGDFSDSEIEADGFSIRYREAGSGDALVCLHGGGGLKLTGVHDILAASRRVVAFEIPGFGASPENTRSASLEELAGTMNAAVSALGIEAFAVMGNSFGANLALMMAVIRPEPIQSIVLVAPAAIRLEAPPATIDPRADPSTLLYAHPERQPVAQPTPPEIQAKQRALVGRLIGPPCDRPFEDRLSAIEVDVLALFGTLDRVTPPEVAHLYREIIPTCNLVMVYDAAHAIDADRPEAVASVVDDFLTHHEGFLVRRKSGVIHP